MENKLTLQDVEWKEFKLIDIFDIKDGYYNKKPPMTENKGLPFLGATQFNNGITGFVDKSIILKYDKVGDISNKNIADRIFEGNCFAITNNGSVGNIFYQKSKFTCSHDITPVYLKNIELNENIAKFLIPLLKKSGESFEYAKKWRPKRMRKSRMLLPIDKNGNPNWQFMEDYIKQEQKEITEKVVNYYQNKLDEILENATGGALQPIKYKNVNWKVFEFNDIFREIKRGKRLTKANQIDGKMPYISSSAMTNGVDNFISNDEKVRKFDNCLSVANSGSVGACFYHKYEYVASDHITSLKLDNENADEYIYLFMASIISRLEEKYSFNREINDIRIQREKLILPADENGNPNYKYMKNFVINIQKDNIEKTLEYIYIYIISTIVASYKDKYSLKNTQWKEFFIEDIFEIKSGKDIYERERIDGNTPYITSTANNNGVGYYISNSNKTLEKGCISVNRNGSVGYSFYHDYMALFGNDTRKLVPYNKNKYSSIFLTNVITHQKAKYGYGYKMGTARLKKQKIMLPIDKNENPNYDFMENYIKFREFEKYIEIIKNIY